MRQWRRRQTTWSRGVALFGWTTLDGRFCRTVALYLGPWCWTWQRRKERRILLREPEDFEIRLSPEQWKREYLNRWPEVVRREDPER